MIEHQLHLLLFTIPLVISVLYFFLKKEISFKKTASILFVFVFLLSHTGSHHILVHFDSSKSDQSHYCCIPLPADLPISEVVLFIFIVFFTNLIKQGKYQYLLITSHWGRAPPQT